MTTINFFNLWFVMIIIFKTLKVCNNFRLRVIQNSISRTVPARIY